MAQIDQVTLRQSDIDNFTDSQLNSFKNRLNLNTIVPGTYQLMPTNASNIDASNKSGVTIAQNGVSNSGEDNFKGLGALDGTLGQYIPQAQNIYNSLYSKSKEQQEKEDRMNTGMMMLNFFTKMGAEASRPGATALGAASVAGADTASMYIKRVNADRARRDAEKKGVVGLATQLMTASGKVDTKTLYINRTKKPVTDQKGNVVVPAGGREYLSQRQLALLPNARNLTAFKEEKAPQSAKDEYGVLRYTSGPNKGKKVFPNDVIEEKEIEEKQFEKVDSVAGEFDILGGEDLVQSKLDDYANEHGNVVPIKPTKEKLRPLTLDQQKFVTAYRGDLQKNLKKFYIIKAQYTGIKKFFATKSSINDYALAVAMAKILDPESVARSSEVDAVNNATSIALSTKQALINVLTGDGKMPPRVRAEIYNTAGDLYQAELDNVTPKMKGLRESVESNNIQFGHVFFDKPFPPPEEKISVSDYVANNIEPEFPLEGELFKMTVNELRALSKKIDTTREQKELILKVLIQIKKSSKK